MKPLLLALSLLSPVPTSAPIVQQAAASYALLPIARADPSPFDQLEALIQSIKDEIAGKEKARDALTLEIARDKARLAKAIGGGGVTPPPPDPVLSETAQKVRALVAQVPASARPAAARLAAAYRAQAAAIQATDTADAIIIRSREANRAALAGDIDAWRQFFAGLKGVLDSLVAAGTLKTPEDHRREWNAIASGLDSAVGVTQR